MANTKMGLWSKEQLRSFIKENKLVSAQDAQNAMKELFAETIQEMLEAEMDTHLGYEKRDTKQKATPNHRNGKSKKTIVSEYDEQDIVIPRDREAEFDPVVVKKHQSQVVGIEDQIIALYAKGVSTRDIQDHLKQLYGIDASPTLISNVTNKIMPLIKEWQNRPLQEVYAILRRDIGVLPKDGDPNVHHSSDSQFDALRVVQGFEEGNGRPQAHL